MRLARGARGRGGGKGIRGRVWGVWLYACVQHLLTHGLVEIRKGLVANLVVRAAEEDAQVPAAEAGP